MNFQRYLQSPVLSGFWVIPLIDLLFLLLIFFGLVFSFHVPNVVKVSLPKVITSDIASDNNLTIFITGEGVFYYNNKVMTLSDISRLLSDPHNRQRQVLIKFDRRAAAGAVVDVWDIGRRSGFEKINIATDQDD